MVRPQCRPLYVNPAAMAWLIHNTIRLHHVVQSVSIDVRPHYNSCCEVIVCKTKAHISWMSKMMMPLEKKNENDVMLEQNVIYILDKSSCRSLLHCDDFGNMIIIFEGCQSLIWCLRQFCRWLCNCVSGADKSRGSLCPEADVCQQWAWSAGVQMWDSNYGEWLMVHISLACCHTKLIWFSLVVQTNYKPDVFWNCNVTCSRF